MIVLEQKQCSRCSETKSLDSFSKDKHHSSGYKSACKVCANIDFKNWRNQNLDKVREQDKIKMLVKKYKLSKEEATVYANNRLGECTICKTEAFRVVDHCHVTGDVRGFICSACNSMLGYARDNIKTLEAAIEYLRSQE